MNSSQSGRNIGQGPGETRYDAGLNALVKSLQFVFFLLVLIILGMLVYFFTFGGYFTVKPQQSIIVLRFGKYVDTYKEGWHWFFPYPVNSFIEVPTNPQYLQVSFKAAEVPGPPEMQAMGRPLKPGQDRYLLSGDFNIVHSSWQMEYTIVDPKLYYESCLTPQNPMNNDELLKDNDGDIMGTRGPQTLLRSVLRSCVIKVCAGMPVDNLLYTGKETCRDEVQQLFAKTIADMNIGVDIRNLQLIEVSAPASTKRAFAEVTEAKQASSSMINKANSFSIKNLGEAESQTAEILADARTYQKIVVAEAKADSIYFDKIFIQYKLSPETVLAPLYNSVLSDVMSQVKDKYVFTLSGGKQELRLKINPEPPKPNLKPEKKAEQ